MIDRLCRSWPWFAVVVCSLAIGGCRRAANSTTAGQPSAPAFEIALKTPEDATRSLLAGLREQLQATARGDRAAARRCRDAVVDLVAAKDQIMARLRAQPGHVPQKEAEVLAALVENWASIVSYYADGLALKEMRLIAAGNDGGGAAVEVPAQGADDCAILRVACVRGANDEWRILAIGLEPAAIPTPATQATAASQPASEPAPRGPA